MVARIRTLILGAAGRDFHDFNMLFRADVSCDVVAFTAQQIPHIADRRYPASLAGPLYPEGIPIYAEDELESLIERLRVRECVLSYSDLSYAEVMHLASRANAAGADFRLVAAARTMLRSKLPVVAVCAARTGAGKSPLSRAVARTLSDAGHRVAVIRHPMPYGDLEKQRVQRFATVEDMDRAHTTIEEREEYEPHIAAGGVVFAGVDYEGVLAAAEREADVIVWDGGNNDTPFLRPTLHITVVDPHRPGHETGYYPGETNVRMADVIVVSKVDSADPAAVAAVIENVRRVNPGARVVRAGLPITIDDPSVIAGRRVLVIEDGPTLTHGGMTYGAGTLAARRAGAAELVDPRPFAVGEIAGTLARYPALTGLLPAMGYGEAQVRDLEATIGRAADAGAEAVLVATPIDLGRLIRIPIAHTRARYAIELLDGVTVDDLLGGLEAGAVATSAVGVSPTAEPWGSRL